MAGPYKSLEDLDAALASKEPAQPYKSIGDLDAAITQSDANDETRLGFSAKQSLTSKPDQYIKARDLGGQFGIPPDVAERNLPEVEYRNKLDALISTMRSSPALGTLMQDPGYLKRTHDDIDALAQVELQTRGFKEASTSLRKRQDDLRNQEFEAMIGRMPTAPVPQDVAGTSVMDETHSQNLTDSLRKGALNVAVQGEVLAAMIDRALASAGSLVLPKPEAGGDVTIDSTTQQTQAALVQAAEAFAAAPSDKRMEVAGRIFEEAYNHGQSFKGLGDAIGYLAQNPAAVLNFMGEMGVAAAPGLAVGGGVTAPFRERILSSAMSQAMKSVASKAVTGAGVGFFANMAPTIGGEISEGLTKFDGDIRKALDRATTKGLAEGSVNALFGAIPLPFAGMGPAARMGNVLAETAYQATGGAAGAAAASASVGEEISVAELFLEAIGEGFGAPADLAVSARQGYAYRAATEMFKKGLDSERSLQAEAKLTQMVDVAAQTASIARDPSAVQELVNAADEDGQTELYINARQFANVFNQSPVETAAALGVDATALNDALASNTDLVVPLSTFATAVARDQALRPIIEHTRVDPGDMSPVEARLWQSQQGDQFKAEAEAVLAKRQADETFKAGVQQVHDNLLGQLNQAGRWAPQVNQKYAAMVRDFYVTMADRAGMTVTEMAAKYPLRVVAEGQGALQQRATLDNQFPLVRTGDAVDGRVVREDVPNLSSIGASLDDYTVMDGVREVPMSAFDKSYIDSIKPEKLDDRTRNLVEQIKQSGELNPLIVALDSKGAYIIEGGHRFDALIASGAKSLPAVVIIDESDPPSGYNQPAVPPAPTLQQPAYHGSPYKFDKFSLEHLGKGEGAQAYGWGLYFAGKKGVAEHYRKALTGAAVLSKRHITPEEVMLTNTGDVPASTVKKMRAQLAAFASQVDFADQADVRRFLRVWFPRAVDKLPNDFKAESPVMQSGQLYEVDIPEEGSYLLWDKPLSEQPEAVKAALASGGYSEGKLLNWKTSFGADVSGTFEQLSGEGFYGALENLNGSAEAASKYLNSLGIAGIKYLDGTSRDKGEGSFNYVIFDDSAVQILNTYYQGEDSPRASFDPSTNTIALLEGADWSSFLHESGHFFLEVMADLASRPDAPASIRKDFETALAWMGVAPTPELDAIGTWNLMTLDEKRPYHEKWARGYEAYLFEGRSPSVEMQGIFQRFSQWLKQVYTSLKALNVDLTDDVRGVFDRMLASEDAIKTAEAVRNFAPIFQTPEQAAEFGVDWEAYQAENKEASDTAVDELQARSIRDMRWQANAKAKKIKELQATAKELRAEVKIDVRREVLSQPLYRAWQFLTGKNPDQIAKVKEAKSDPNKVDPTKDTLLTAIAKLGGLDKLQAVEEWGLDPKEKIPQVAFGKPVVRKDGGLKLGAMAEALAEYGYLEVDPTGKWDNRQFKEMFFDALRGGEYFSQYGEDAMIAAATRDAQGDPDAGITLENTPAGKLNTEMLKGMYGETDTAPWRLLSALRMTSPDGLAPDQVADLFGFTSGDDLVRRLAVAEDPKALIDQLTDQRMLELHGDLATPAEIELAAERAIHNDVRARVLTRELNALRKATGQGNVMLKAARMHADQWLARQTVKNATRHAQHVAAEGRSARAVTESMNAGDLAAAAQHKLDQVLNNQLARGSIRAAEEVRKAVKYLKKFDKAGSRKAIDQDYLDQIDQLLERFDLRQVSGKALEKRASLAAWLKQQEEMGLDPVIDAALVEEAQRQHYSTLTLEEFRGLVDSIQSIEHLGRLKNRLLTAKDKREFKAVKDELVANIVANANRDVTTTNAITPLEKGAKILRNFSAMHRKFASIVREMDGGKDGGPMWEYLVRTMNEAGDREVTLRGEMSEKFADLFDGIKGIKLNEKVFVPDLRISLRREELLAIALNSGNDGNVQRLLDGGINESLQAITGRQLMGVLNQITDKEWDFVEGVWQMIEENRPAIAAQEKALTGVEPKWVDPTPFTLASGRVIRGGYYPAKYNADMSTRSNELEAVTDLRQQMQGAAGRSATRKSYTEQRSKEVTGRPLRLDLGVISQHINEVTHRLAWQEWLIDARRILNATEIDRAIRDHYGPEILAQMKKQLADIAAGDNGPTDALDKVMNHIRNGTTIAGMGWNIMTSLMQPIGLTQSVERVGATWIAKGLAEYMRGNPFKVTADVHERSSFMANRAKTLNREINDVLNQIKSERMSQVEASYFYLIQKFQQMVDIPTWLGAYEKAIADGNADDRAVALADQAVIDSQGAGQLKDLSAIQRGGSGQKLFTNFYSFFNTTYQRAVENYRATDFKNPTQVGKLAANYLLLFTLPAVWGWALKEALRGDDDDEDAKKIAKRLAMEQLNYLLGTMVLVREIGSAISGFSGYQGPAGTRFFAELGKLIKQTEQGDVDMALVKAAANTVGIAAHLPTGQIMKSVEGTVAVMDGKAGPQAVLVGPPIKN